MMKDSTIHALFCPPYKMLDAEWSSILLPNAKKAEYSCNALFDI